ncbi:DUF5361 domain-containing protein [Helcococcus kunzii]|uniref:DUF5361 domain-containing protein n=1 Tax=Helcococcus kunzii TaxID=40091 RepID=UPI0038B0009F
MKLSNLNVPLETLMLIDIRDKVNLIFWSKTEDATEGKNRPEMLLGKFVDFKEKEEAKSFDSREEFENERKRILGGIN